MSERLNIKLKDGVEPSVLLKYGFIPKYDENTGLITKLVKKFHIGGVSSDETHFTFVYYIGNTKGGIFRRCFHYEAWMSGFSWSNVCDKEALRLLFDLITDGIVEIAEE